MSSGNRFRQALLAWLLLQSACANALVIETTFVPAGRILAGRPTQLVPPSAVAGGGTLESVVRAAADYWEGVYGDPQTLRVQFAWSSLSPSNVLAIGVPGNAGGSPASETGAILFDNRIDRRWFLDATPFDPSEFSTFQESATDLGAGLVNTAARYTGATGDAVGATDLFTVALHEIGHLLGMAGLDLLGHNDGFVDITDPRPNAGSRIPLASDASHLTLRNSVMAPSTDIEERKLPTDADILAIAQVNGWTQFALRGVQSVPEPASGLLLALGVLLLWLASARPAVAVRRAQEIGL